VALDGVNRGPRGCGRGVQPDGQDLFC
jgi:hypothetical protein